MFALAQIRHLERLEHLQRPKEAGGLVMPNTWLYHLATQLQHLCKNVFLTNTELSQSRLDSSLCILLYTLKMPCLPIDLEAETFAKSNRLLPTYCLIQKIWNKAKQLQQVTAFSHFSPIWHNIHYPELAKLQTGL